MMAEHEKVNFEHEIDEKLRMLDEEIKIPEIPDAQRIFGLAEKKDNKVLPFIKYRKIAGIAAAVVLICAGVPIISGVLGAGIVLDGAATETAEAPMSEQYVIFDSTKSNNQVVQECVEEPGEAPEETPEEPVVEENQDFDSVEEEDKSAAASGKGIKYFLNEFFRSNSTSQGSVNGANGVDGDDVSSIAEKFNKKRSMDIEIEKDSVSVILYDDSADGEIITAFWVEGTYQTSYRENEKYYLNTVKKVTEEEIENDYYLPMLGDAVNGTYYIEEDKIKLPEKIIEGAISVWVEIDIGTGEYEITAEII